jgi:HSP20 family protein
MSLIRWQPLRELDTMRQQMNRLFDDLMHGDRIESLLPKIGTMGWAPAIELQETDTDIILKAQLPGIDAKDLDIQVSQDAVLIAGEHKEEKTTEEKGIYRTEFHYGQFQRVIPLPVAIRNDRVAAEFKDGILTLTIPKVEGMARNVVKINLQEKAREGMTKQRMHDEHLQETMHARASAELEKPKDGIQEQAREAMTEQRMQDEHLQETMHTRAESEVNQ